MDELIEKRKIAILWWRKLSGVEKIDIKNTLYKDRNYWTLTGREIETLYNNFQKLSL